ncbi:hypothetical protein [Pseudorhodoplanes sinuspersici]|uniref:Uncharacterized protein n=1 Tax=Pseudorhodoplanes sinuspersici TaxID=1235591 RepID=A0A1W6ZQP5_9HYPH|nr:hypothetical protein [Pseudorhodoplanes sinuspersici]ARP99689.1 hypothetical protein CAK95_11765 [Pseudorhodoplanes sinuspersici]RKE70672.1 hypothetical protein DFP91_2914 [Pseudorhodoplanes sinuspersici]
MTTYRSTSLAVYAAKFTFFVASLAFGASAAQGQVIDNFHGNTPATAQAYRSAPTITIEARGAQARAVDRGARKARAQVRSNQSRNAQPQPAGTLAGSYYIDQDPDINVRMLVQKDFAHQ